MRRSAAHPRPAPRPAFKPMLGPTGAVPYDSDDVLVDVAVVAVEDVAVAAVEDDVALAKGGACEGC